MNTSVKASEHLRPHTRPFVVGLTGGVGSGKSSAAQCFADHGICVVDTDAIAHQLTGVGGAAISEIQQSFGNTVLASDGSLDRAAMRHIVFVDSSARARLEAILHPKIRVCSDEAVASATSPYVILMVPLLIESTAYRERCDRIAVVDCPESIQIQRVMVRSKLTEPEVRAIIAAQVNRDVRRAAANDIIDNGNSFDSLRYQVDALHVFYLNLAEKRASVETAVNKVDDSGKDSFE